MGREDEVNIKSFNVAKRYAEEILFPMMNLYQSFQRRSDFGADDLDKAFLLSEEVRDIERYNGLKGMNDILGSLLSTISSTVILHKNKEEIEQLKLLQERVEKTKRLFYENRSLFFVRDYSNFGVREKLDRKYFDKIKNLIQVCYINTEILMTRNKLLFSDASNEFKDDEEIMEQIKKEFSEG